MNARSNRRRKARARRRLKAWLHRRSVDRLVHLLEAFLDRDKVRRAERAIDDFRRRASVEPTIPHEPDVQIFGSTVSSFTIDDTVDSQTHIVPIRIEIVPST